MIIYVDLDGVLADFATGLAKAVGMPNPYVNDKNLGKRDIASMLKIDQPTYAKIVSEDMFWMGLQPFPDGMQMMLFLEQEFGAENIFLLSAPPPFPGAWAGKIQWVTHYLEDYVSRTVLSMNKHMMYREDAILIDDYDRNIIPFGENGILYPALSNMHYGRIADKGSYIGERLGEILS